MKTTLDINDELFRQMRDIAQHDKVTLKSLVEQGLRLVIKSREAAPARKRAEPVVFKGRLGFTPEFEGKDWRAFKDEARRR
ncbi:hypothetical protein [Fulvimonas soli]|jgi:hypothetical protein|nr:hypothetical protein [Fulvimonas soli]TNY27594.1 hypothetical protein BV497_02715 [Fulvimonas soli]